MKTFWFIFPILLILGFFPPLNATSIQLPALWVFIDYNMPIATFDLDAPLNEGLIIERIKCILRLPEHLIVFNYKTPYKTGIRASLQIIADLIHVRPENRTKVGTAKIIAYQKALDQARDDGKLSCFVNANFLGLNSMPMTAWVSERTITIAPYDANNFTACPVDSDYSEVVRNTYTTYLNETSFDYFPQDIPIPDVEDNLVPSQTLNGYFMSTSMLVLVGLFNILL